MLSISYQVVRVSSQDAVVPVTLADGSVVTASVPSVEVEMVPVDRMGAGTIKLSFTGDERAQATAAFIYGATVTVPWGSLPAAQ